MVPFVVSKTTTGSAVVIFTFSCVCVVSCCVLWTTQLFLNRDFGHLITLGERLYDVQSTCDASEHGVTTAGFIEEHGGTKSEIKLRTCRIRISASGHGQYTGSVMLQVRIGGIDL